MISSFFDKSRAKTIGNLILPYISDYKTLLDFGAGSCRVAEYISQNSNLSVTAIDTVDHNKTLLPLQIYDGKKLPFMDNYFDATTVLFVLHHTEDFDQIFNEVLRVSKHRIFVLEDTPTSKLEKYFWRKLDYGLNHAKHEDIDVAHGTKSTGEWEDFFASKKLELIHVSLVRKFSLTGGLYAHSLFVLNKE